VSLQFKTEYLPNFLRCQFYYLSFGCVDIKGRDRATEDTRELCSKKLQGFIEDAKIGCLHFLHESLNLLNCQKVFILIILTVFLPEIASLGALAKFRKAAIIFVMSVCLSVGLEQLSSHCTNFHEI